MERQDNEDEPMAIVVDKLSKRYGKFLALSRLSFAIQPGECFGLLGINGAGKNSTFKMLTGDTLVSSGDAFLRDKTCSLTKHRLTFIRNVGYCPQFDAILGNFTGQEMLELFCRLRGHTGDGRSIKQEATTWLEKFGLDTNAHARCGRYSGGMKRRLSTDMALIGHAPVVMLDEPTSGVDLVSRRQFWKILASSREAGQAVILTSHSMDECEALCNRLGILVQGQLQCLGSVSHLKSKFGVGYSLTVKLKVARIMGETPEEQELALSCHCEALGELIIAKFPPSKLLDQNQNMMEFQLLNNNLHWDEIFSTMEALKNNVEGSKINLARSEDEQNNYIDDYYVMEASLEQIFLLFARRQAASI